MSDSFPKTTGLAEAAGSVEIISEKLQGKQRRICARICIPRSLEQVWQVLTDYEHLADFVPNLAKSVRLAAPEGKIWLEQVGIQCFLNIQFCARVVLDMEERYPHELGFSMLEGDFKAFRGCWRLVPLASDDGASTHLCYELTVQPPRAMPAALIEKHIRHNLIQNLIAIRQQAIAIA
ncbi:MAG: cyclase [Leptolyngbyaceae cyanobacterium SM1_1_3]|nr:cyclase [Leptolyngbyaceae cyanobacterium SM1_1_3]NJN01791.1 cyclase [Leptolyngbyaceae cyanobacterium RM1_1_2]NJO09788.1 cyclase [Leptolyngbyaceae cyanobacterium SL_1_1]